MPGPVEKKGIPTVPTQPLQKNERGAMRVTEKFNKLSELVNKVPSPITSTPPKVKTRPKVSKKTY